MSSLSTLTPCAVVLNVLPFGLACIQLCCFFPRNPQKLAMLTDLAFNVPPRQCLQSQHRQQSLKGDQLYLPLPLTPAFWPAQRSIVILLISSSPFPSFSPPMPHSLPSILMLFAVMRETFRCLHSSPSSTASFRASSDCRLARDPMYYLPLPLVSSFPPSFIECTS